MNAAQRKELYDKGIGVLRPQYDGRKGIWRIAKYSGAGSGGWKMFGASSGYTSKEECQSKIDMLASKLPSMYHVDN